MKYCIVYGNCHVWPIRKYLTSSTTFNQIYQMIEIPPVHECNMETGIEQHYLNQCDLFIYQNVGNSFGEYLSTNYILSKLPDKCKRISIGNAYFVPYYPQLETATDGFPYCDKNVIRLLQQGLNKQQVLNLISDDDFYSFNEIQSLLLDSINELRRREASIDIPIVDYIEHTYKIYHIFCTINHPQYPLIQYLSMRILETLGIPSGELLHYVYDIFNDHIHPIYPSVIKHLGLTTIKPSDRCFTIGHQKLTFQEYIGKYIDYIQSRQN
ncbi:WcbI family polysaccharide biosynthesis putative acetyltransferase [Peribacillus sp. NJ4]|uniref:WcbI family polysaccharide biosynthesis putative acetyltransferase n=1 Tax=Peribacillus sp. NJ4 TaxID=3055862 RepID=UPI0025A26C0A|nr:WcbI family polysaccharide biosynthesis putative acetyltransferase [Peribacillus sp. NJ4]MDM5215174.1 WcbI family polysaccharide biosynthesis putative acetyltransferase [Peribacillus sp. NJ4]